MKYILTITVYFICFGAAFSQDKTYQSIEDYAYDYVKKKRNIDLETIYKKEVETLSFDQFRIAFADPKTGVQYKWIFITTEEQTYKVLTECIFFKKRNKTHFWYYYDNKVSMEGWGSLKYIHRLNFYTKNEELAQTFYMTHTRTFMIIRRKGKTAVWGDIYHKTSRLGFENFFAEYETLMW